MRVWRIAPAGLMFTILLVAGTGFRYLSDPADDYFALGLRHFRNQEYSKAVEAYSRAIELRPGFVKAHYNRGVARLNLADHQTAIQDFDVVLRDDSNHLKAHLYRGFCQLKLANWPAARSDFDFVLSLDPGHTDAI